MFIINNCIFYFYIKYSILYVFKTHLSVVCADRATASVGVGEIMSFIIPGSYQVNDRSVSAKWKKY